MTTPSEDYRTIPLTKGKAALVDATDYEWLMQWKWSANNSANDREAFYAKTEMRIDGTDRTVQMHRLIMGVGSGRENPIKVDHHDGNGLNNRRYNLRLATTAQNNWNTGIPKHNKTGFKGVSKQGNSYRAQIKVNGKCIHLGTRKTAREAYEELWVPAAKEHHGEFARFE